MDFLRQRAEHSAAVRIVSRLAVGAVLRSRTGARRKSAFYATVGRAIHADAVYGVRKMVWWLDEQGYLVNPKRVRRLMRVMGLEAIYPKPRLSLPTPGHKIYPYLLRDLTISRPDQAWCSDITYIRLRGGFIFLVAVMDWFSRYVLAWEVSVSLGNVILCFSAELGLRVRVPGYLQRG